MNAVSDRLFNKLESIFAYDTGSVDSGIHDEGLRRELVAELDALTENEIRVRLSAWVANAYLSPEAIRDGYGWEDALSFLRWIDDGSYRRP